MKTKIAFDFDGVIANTTKKKQEWLKINNINLRNTDKTSFYKELQKNMPKEKVDQIYKEMSHHIFTEENLLEIEGAIKSIKKLSNIYDIYIITARTEPLILHVKKWLEKNHLQEDITKIISSSWEEKQNICIENNINFLCDDDIKHLEKHKIENRVLFSSVDNIKDSNIREVNSWNEIENILKIV